MVLTHGCGASAEVRRLLGDGAEYSDALLLCAQIYLYGACVTSWKQAAGDEVLYVRPDAVFDKSKPISGGIPHCFPQVGGMRGGGRGSSRLLTYETPSLQFGPSDKMQQHGFARNLDWSIASTSADPNPDEKDPSVELVLSESDYTLKM